MRVGSHVVTQFTIKHSLGFIILRVCTYFIFSVFCLFGNLGEKILRPYLFTLLGNYDAAAGQGDYININI